MESGIRKREKFKSMERRKVLGTAFYVKK